MAGGDSYYSSVTLALHCDGVTGSALIVDSSPSPKTLTVKSGTMISASSKFGSGSVKTTPAGGFSVPNVGVSDFGEGDFTIEFQMYPVAASGYFCGSFDVGTNVASFYFALAADGMVSFPIFNSATESINLSSPPAMLVPGAFKHIAVSRIGQILRMFIDGALVGTRDLGASFVLRAAVIPLNFGSIDTGAVYACEAYFDEIRITKGVGRYSSAFDAPIAAFDAFTVASFLSGNVKNRLGVNSQNTVRAYRQDSGQLVGTVNSDSSGNYSIGSPYAGPHTLLFYPSDGNDLNALVLSGVFAV
jgi:hypothetical protein